MYHFGVTCQWCPPLEPDDAAVRLVHGFWKNEGQLGLGLAWSVSGEGIESRRYPVVERQPVVGKVRPPVKSSRMSGCCWLAVLPNRLYLSRCHLALKSWGSEASLFATLSFKKNLTKLAILHDYKHGKYRGWNGSTVKISCWAVLAQLSAGIKNSPKNLCSHVIFIVFFKF